MTPKDIADIEAVKDVLEVMKTCTTVLSSSRHATASLILPTQHTIVTTLKSSCVGDDTPVVREVKCTIYNDMESRYSDTGLADFLLECCVIDPRFKNLRWVPEDEQADIYDRVVRRVLQQYEHEPTAADLVSHSNTDTETGNTSD